LFLIYSSIYCTKKILIDIPINIQNEKKQTWHPKINRYYLDESYIEIPKQKYETNFIQIKQPFLGFKKKEEIEKKKCTCRFVKDEIISNQNNYQQILQPQQIQPQQIQPQQILQPQQQILTNNQIPFNNQQQQQQIFAQQPQQIYTQQQPQQQIYPNQMMFNNPQQIYTQQQPLYYQNNNNNNNNMGAMLYPNQNNLGNVQPLPPNPEPNKIVINNNPTYGIYPPSNIQPNVQNNNAIPVLNNVIPQQIQGFLNAINY